MSWICSTCECNNANLNEQCVYCFHKKGIVTLRPASISYDETDALLFKVRDSLVNRALNLVAYEITRLSKVTAGEKPMNAQEEKFANFFNSEKQVINQMSILELRAHREELAEIAFEAKARLTAVDDEERGRKAKNKSETTGFSRSVQTDEITTDAINKINARQKKLDKSERLKNLMMKSGIFDEKTADYLMSAGTVLARINASGRNESFSPEEVKKVVNPFEKKTEAEVTDVTITEDNTVIVTKTESVEEPKPKVSFNPFQK